MVNLLIISLAAIVFISGCTIPGTNIAIPFIPDIFGAATTEYQNDILVIKNLQVAPSTTVKAGQPLTLFADIENLDRPEKGKLPRDGQAFTDPIRVELFDFCTNLMSDNAVLCPGQQKEEGGSVCEIENIFPKEIKTISWELTPRGDLELEQECELKLKVTYPYKTDAVTSISFIDADELQNRIRRGEPYVIQGSEARGEGPLKPYLKVESQQPISTESQGQISLQLRNVGSGFVPFDKDTDKFNIKMVQVDFTEPELTMLVDNENTVGGCEISEDRLKLINKETPPVFCFATIPEGKVNVVGTYNLETSVDYQYEFRSSIKVKIVPKESAL